MPIFYQNTSFHKASHRLLLVYSTVRKRATTRDLQLRTNTKRYINNLHPDEEQVKWYECANCPFKTKNPPDLQRHVICGNLNRKDVKLYECEECPFKTKFNSCLKKHINGSHSKQPEWYECANWSYKSKSKRNLTWHVRVHLEIKSYQCGYCTYRAKHNRDLKCHVNHRHLDGADAKWYKCEQCPYEVKNRSAFYLHKKKHA